MKYYVIDAFADKLFSGNPAGVCIVEAPITDEVMQKIAFENNLSETAFVRKAEDGYSLRWFTPTFEIDLCGHATLASAFVVMNYIEPAAKSVEFHTLSGVLTVERKDGLFEMALPLKPVKRIAVTDEISAKLGFVPDELYSGRDLYAVVGSEEQVLNFIPDYDKLKLLENWMGISITSKGKDCDFVSRFFCPELKLEDPVTGSAHSCLVPIWREKLQKSEFVAKQLSSRGGTLFCRLCGDSVKISGKAVLYLKGEI